VSESVISDRLAEERDYANEHHVHRCQEDRRHAEGEEEEEHRVDVCHVEEEEHRVDVCHVDEEQHVGRCDVEEIDEGERCSVDMHHVEERHHVEGSYHVNNHRET
jgi:hypothetical protein